MNNLSHLSVHLVNWNVVCLCSKLISWLTYWLMLLPLMLLLLLRPLMLLLLLLLLLLLWLNAVVYAATQEATSERFLHWWRRQCSRKYVIQFLIYLFLCPSPMHSRCIMFSGYPCVCVCVCVRLSAQPVGRITLKGWRILTKSYTNILYQRQMNWSGFEGQEVKA